MLSRYLLCLALQDPQDRVGLGERYTGVAYLKIWTDILYSNLFLRNENIARTWKGPVFTTTNKTRNTTVLTPTRPLAGKMAE